MTMPDQAPQTLDELRERVHDMVDAYLDAGGPAECMIMSQKDASRFREQARQEVLDEVESMVTDLELHHQTDIEILADVLSVINAKRKKGN